MAVFNLFRQLFSVFGGVSSATSASLSLLWETFRQKILLNVEDLCRRNAGKIRFPTAVTDLAQLLFASRDTFSSILPLSCNQYKPAVELSSFESILSPQQVGTKVEPCEPEEINSDCHSTIQNGGEQEGSGEGGRAVFNARP